MKPMARTDMHFDLMSIEDRYDELLDLYKQLENDKAKLDDDLYRDTYSDGYSEGYDEGYEVGCLEKD